MRLTNGESSTGTRDEVDFGFVEINEMTLDDEMHIEDQEMHMEARTERSERSERSSRTPFDEYDNGHQSDPDYVEEATEFFNENQSEDEYDAMVTRGRAKQQKSKKSKKDKPKKSPATRPGRTTRAASVRF